jgi:DedD protein
MGVKKGWSSFMDRRVKERLVGATILVVLIVLIVPELLSGPKQSQAPASTGATSADTVRNVTVDLATSKATADTDAPSASSAGASPDGRSDGSVGAGNAAGGAGVAPVAHPPPTVSTLQAQPSSTVENDPSSPILRKGNRANSAPVAAAATPDGAHHHWAVQLGSFASQINAERLVHQLKGQGFTAYIMPGGPGTGSLYRVRIGPLADRASAERMISRLSKVGHSASVVSP